MKRLNWIGILALCLCWGVCLKGYSITSLKNSGTWDGGTLENNISITLTDNISMKGTIEIPSGKTLTIEATANHTIKNITDGLSGMFIVRTGGKLVIQGTANGRITIDGGANFTWNGNPTDGVYLKKGTNSISLKVAAIYNEGTLDLDYVTIQNVNNSVAGYSGGAIRIQGAGATVVNGPTTLDNCIIQKCAAGHGSALQITTQNTCADNTPTSCPVSLTDCIIQHCYTGINNQSGETSTEGGTIRTNGGAISNLNLTRVQVLNNYSGHSGAGIYWNAGGRPGSNPVCTFNECTFRGNKAGVRGGAMMLETSFSFTGKKTIISENTAGERGGGIVITGYGGGGIESGTFDHDFNQSLEVSGNSAPYGGGIAYTFGEMSFTAPTTYNVKFNGATIKQNISMNEGGGVHFSNRKDEFEQNTTIGINIYLNNGNISGNKAAIGAGMYILKTDISNNDNSATLIMQNNTASQDGGAVYSDGSNVTLGTISVTGNTAVTNGGGLCIKNGTFTMQDGSNISNNTATNGNGGGLYINSTSGTVKCSGGTFVGNRAKAGGGACIDGALTVALDATLEDNEATNGGGIYLANGATLNFGSGLIRRNKAESSESLNTAYHGTATTVSGIGGGIFLADKTTLAFTNTEALGIYNNSASKGADDIFANGNGTKITLPVIENMSLKGFDVPGSKLYWVEDYVSDDTKYSEGTQMKTSGGVYRYQDALRLGLSTWPLGSGQISPNSLTCYTCLTLSYELIYVTLVKKGLKVNDDAIFTISYPDKNNNDAPKAYRKLILTGTGSDVEKVVALPSGKWKFEESSVWGKKYQSQSADWIDITHENKRVEITNTPIDTYNQTIEAEHRVVNRLKP